MIVVLRLSYLQEHLRQNSPSFPLNSTELAIRGRTTKSQVLKVKKEITL